MDRTSLKYRVLTGSQLTSWALGTQFSIVGAPALSAFLGQVSGTEGLQRLLRIVVVSATPFIRRIGMFDQLRFGTSNTIPIDRCPNCGSSSVEAFCAACGQDQRRSELTVREWLPDFMAELLSVDGPVVRTTQNLLIAPGRLTGDWLNGRRARYLSPLRIYIVIAAGFFLIWPLFGADPGAVVRGVLPDHYFLPPPMGLGLNAIRFERVVANAFPLILLLGSVPLSAWINKGGWVTASGASYIVQFVFALHVHAFALTCLLFLGLLRAASGLNVVPLVLIAVPLYLIYAARAVFNQSWALTAVRSVLTLWIHAMLMFAGLALIAYLYSGGV